MHIRNTLQASKHGCSQFWILNTSKITFYEKRNRFHRLVRAQGYTKCILLHAILIIDPSADGELFKK